MGEMHAAATKWLADTSRGISAYAANLADPITHRAFAGVKGGGKIGGMSTR
jgi:hypothetical protein